MTNLYPIAAPVGRVLLALIFIISGAGKLADTAGTMAYMEYGGVPGILLWPTILVELGGGILLAIGYQTRWAALALAGFSLVSGVLFHLIPGMAAEGMEAQMQTIGFMKNLSIAGGMLFVFSLGAGAYSLDNRMRTATA